MCLRRLAVCVGFAPPQSPVPLGLLLPHGSRGCDAPGRASRSPSPRKRLWISETTTRAPCLRRSFCRGDRASDDARPHFQRPSQTHQIVDPHLLVAEESLLRSPRAVRAVEKWRNPGSEFRLQAVPGSVNPPEQPLPNRVNAELQTQQRVPRQGSKERMATPSAGGPRARSITERELFSATGDGGQQDLGPRRRGMAHLPILASRDILRVISRA